LTQEIQKETAGRGEEVRLTSPVGIRSESAVMTGASVPTLVPVRRRVRRLAVAAIVFVLAAAGAAFYWWQQTQNQLPPGIFWSNGRIESDEINIDTKFAGRIATLLVSEGDMVKAGQVVARMDTKDLEAKLKQAEAQVQQATKAIEEGRAALVQQGTQFTLAKQQLERTTALAAQGTATRELLDQRRQQFDSARAGIDAAAAHVAQAEQVLQVAQQTVELTQIDIADNSLVAPTDGRIQYRIAQPGEVLPAGGRVLTMIDIASVYMDVFLPTNEAGRLKIGSDARIVIDAYPGRPIPAKVSFIATHSQFTPKAVETRTERERLMFRVRVRIDPDLLRAHAESVRTGLPGVAYVRSDVATAWPARLEGPIGQ
jgi:HlyD family secretion protein